MSFAQEVEAFRQLLRELTVPDSVDIIVGEITGLVFSRNSCVGRGTWNGNLVRALNNLERVLSIRDARLHIRGLKRLMSTSWIGIEG